MKKWWGYLHTDGTMHAKRFFDDMEFVEATQSPFVDQIMEPFDASDSGEALQMVMQYFRSKSEASDGSERSKRS